VYLRARMYDPQLGRFLQRDPFPGFMGVPLSLNRFTYVENNPATLADPTGLTGQGTPQVTQGGIDCTDRFSVITKIVCGPPNGMTPSGLRIWIPDAIFDIVDKLGGLSRWPKVLWQVVEPEGVGGHAGRAAGLGRGEAEHPRDGLVGERVDGLSLAVGGDQPLELAPELVHRIEFGTLLREPQQDDAERGGEALRRGRGVGTRLVKRRSELTQ
jgi:hypothetical protein